MFDKINHREYVLKEILTKHRFEMSEDKKYQLLGDVELKSYFNNEFKNTIYEMVHTIYSHQVDEIVIDEVKAPKNFIYHAIETFTPKFMHRFLVKYKILREKKVIKLLQVFPGLIIPPGERNKVYLIAAELQDYVDSSGKVHQSYDTLGHSEIDFEAPTIVKNLPQEQNVPTKNRLKRKPL